MTFTATINWVAGWIWCGEEVKCHIDIGPDKHVSTAIIKKVQDQVIFCRLLPGITVAGSVVFSLQTNCCRVQVELSRDHGFVPHQNAIVVFTYCMSKHTEPKRERGNFSDRTRCEVPHYLTQTLLLRLNVKNMMKISVKCCPHSHCIDNIVGFTFRTTWWTMDTAPANQNQSNQIYKTLHLTSVTSLSHVRTHGRKTHHSDKKKPSLSYKTNCLWHYNHNRSSICISSINHRFFAHFCTIPSMSVDVPVAIIHY